MENEVKEKSIEKRPLDRKALADIVDLALRAGQLLIQNGAESQRVEETVRLLGTGLGCDWGDVLVSHNALVVSHSSKGEFRTKIRRTSRDGVNMTTVTAVSHLVHRVEEGKYDRFKVREELKRISSLPRHYNRWVTAVMVGLACAAFSRLFGGDWAVFGVTWLAAIGATLVRQELAQRSFNKYLVVIATAFAAGLFVGIANLIHLSSHLEIALAASVLMLVPGVPFINSVEDLIKGHIVVGLAQAVTGVLIILAIALGLILAMQVTGITGL
ncbi:MAG: threonine/serine exporter family protein [Ardenticatenaceae bacterium]|nr:threonine/serine exporter family protein [Ardenticatenaceae bacterium]MCB9445576.1 threonine/serine exporter family protein [Ardenticatenaceae bacterium]